MCVYANKRARTSFLQRVEVYRGDLHGTRSINYLRHKELGRAPVRARDIQTTRSVRQTGGDKVFFELRRRRGHRVARSNHRLSRLNNTRRNGETNRKTTPAVVCDHVRVRLIIYHSCVRVCRELTFSGTATAATSEKTSTNSPKIV